MNLKKKQYNYYFNYSILFVLTLINTTCLFDSIEQEDDSDIVQTTPPPKIGLHPGRIISDESHITLMDLTGNFRTHFEESHISNDDPLVHPGHLGAAHQHVYNEIKRRAV